ncbi:MAG: hypothetical protein K6T34_08420 [Thermoflavifilum sp.]|nr:hypothetical protein [Thermoflavifilum sp.]
MINLNPTWFIEGYVDFELQKYRLLAYLQEINKYFNQNKLYPQLSDVIFHYNNLLAFRHNKKLLQEQFPKKISQVDLQRLEVIYEEMLQDDELMRELELITSFALQEMKHTIDSGVQIYEYVEQQMKIEPVGILPLYKDEGYALLQYENLPDVQVYVYHVTLFEHQRSRYKGIRMEYVRNWHKTRFTTYESLKKDIIQWHKVLPNPAVYLVRTPLHVPFQETLFPIAKRMLMRTITEQDAIA